MCDPSRRNDGERAASAPQVRGHYKIGADFLPARCMEKRAGSVNNGQSFRRLRFRLVSQGRVDFSLPPCGGGVGWGGTPPWLPCLDTFYLSPPHEGEEVLFSSSHVRLCFGQALKRFAEFGRRLKTLVRIALDGLDQELSCLLVHFRTYLARIFAGAVHVAEQRLQGCRRCLLPRQDARVGLVSCHPQGEQIDAVVCGGAADHFRREVIDRKSAVAGLEELRPIRDCQA